MNENIIDSHQHFWQVGLFDYPWMSPDVGVLYRDYLPPGLEPILKNCGVATTVLVQASNSIQETAWMLSLAANNSFIGGVVGWVDLSDPEVEQQLDGLRSDPKFKGVRHLVESEPQDEWLARPDVLRGMKALASRAIPYDMLVHTRHLRHVRTVAETCPELSLVVDHLAKPPVASGQIEDWTREMKQVAAYPNVVCKLSGLVTEADLKGWRTDDLRPYVDCAVELFGPKRLMFGSDYPVCLRAGSYPQVLESLQTLLSHLGEEDQNRIFRENAIDFYKLEDGAHGA
jgi:L-fuconolactonase